MKGAAILAFTFLAACDGAPRSASYFHAHVDVAAQMLVDCEAGSKRGKECDNARDGIAQAQSDQRTTLYRKAFER